MLRRSATFHLRNFSMYFEFLLHSDQLAALPVPDRLARQVERTSIRSKQRNPIKPRCSGRAYPPGTSVSLEWRSCASSRLAHPVECIGLLMHPKPLRHGIPAHRCLVCRRRKRVSELLSLTPSPCAVRQSCEPRFSWLIVFKRRNLGLQLFDMPCLLQRKFFHAVYGVKVHELL